MGIREISYYGWDIIDSRASNVEANITASSYSGVSVNNNVVAVVGTNVYSSGVDTLFTKVSKDGGKSWTEHDFPDYTQLVIGDLAFDPGPKIAINPSNNDIYCSTLSGGIGGQVYLIKSTDYGESWEEVDSAGTFLGGTPGKIAFSQSDDNGTSVFWSASAYDIETNTYALLRASIDGAAFSTAQTTATDLGGTPTPNGAYVAPNGFIYFYWLGDIYKSTDGGASFSAAAGGAYALTSDSVGSLYKAHGSGDLVQSEDYGATWGTSFYDGGFGAQYFLGVVGDSRNNVCFCGFTGSTADRKSGEAHGTIICSQLSSSNVSRVNLFLSASFTDIALGHDDSLYITATQPNQRGFLYRGKYSLNSDSVGPRMLDSSLGYTASELATSSFDNPRTAIEEFKLCNISEFPHSSGLFQMKNMILGTTDSGQIGKSEDNIIQINYVGSVVKIMWPPQADQSVPVMGYGDFSIGQRPGKLEVGYSPGDPIDVSGYDHLSLYCYFVKQVSGSLDHVDLRVERRPLKSTGFAVDQTIEYESSGSVTLAKLKDLVYTKEVDYGNLSIKEVGYPIDIPLTNVREVRVSAQHRIGQSADDNKNFIIWGRLIESDEET